jgi:ribonuclease E
MAKKMLIDSTHSEETRVAVVDNGRLDEFDYESAFRKPLKGNIYLAKVTRVEPSLQAAFVNFGGNRHGFLPFSEIHPDYFRIPVSDREALLAEQEEELKAHDEEEDLDDDIDDGEGETEAVDDDKETVDEVGGDISLDDEDDADDQKSKSKKKTSKAKSKKDDAEEKSEDDNKDDEDNVGNRKDDDEEDEPNGNKADDDDDGEDDNRGNRRGGRGGRGGRGRGRGRGGRGRNSQHKSKRVEKYGDEMDEEQRFRFNLRRKYKIQEVIKRGQIMLVQVSKEERGNKGAAVGSYLSLPGRYCVLMPNSPRAGGISRKISNNKDRAKMRDMIKELEVPKGMSVILRTAGVTRTKAEVKRDLDYLLRLWNTIRETTLESSAPALVYEEADLIKRAVRDLYTRDVTEVHVAGEAGYQTAKNFMKMMIPSHAKKVIEFKDDSTTLFNKYKVEDQIAEIGETTVTLKSGGYLVINPTEALISIDVNSGKATKERHIEETALKTNLEAAEEVARQMRLRDLGGLVVIDFIDMEDRRNNGKVERKMRDALSGDRARIQVGRISSFGLMEMSRQRLSPSLTESQFETCQQCAGTGRVRTADAAGILVLRAIEAEGNKGRAAQVIAHVPNAVALYILNSKRANLAEIEERYNFTVLIRVDESLAASDFRVEVSKPAKKASDNDDDEQGSDDNNSSDDNNGDDEDGKPKRGRRRGRRGGRGRGRGRNQDNQNEDSDDNQDSDNSDKASDSDDSQSEKADKADEKEKKKPAAKKSSSKSSEKTEKKDDEKADKKSDKDGADKKKPAAKKSSSKKKDDDTKADAKDDKKKDDKKKPASKSAKKDKDDGEEKAKPVKKVKASNDDKPEPQDPKEYEVVNAAPEKKKKGWWNKLTD